MWNRVAVWFFLRFYGYGPMAAITLTYPNTALGQCWSFRSLPGSSGGTVLIRLGEVIHVQSVSIEHPISSHVASSTSAIRTFHVFGYEEGDDDIRTLHGGFYLGTFEYDTLKTIRGSAGRMRPSFHLYVRYACKLIPIRVMWILLVCIVSVYMDNRYNNSIF
jgi:Sad1 / UNC-like C-terminal